MLYYRIEKRGTFASDAISNLKEEGKKENGNFHTNLTLFPLGFALCFHVSFTLDFHFIVSLSLVRDENRATLLNLIALLPVTTYFENIALRSENSKIERDKFRNLIVFPDRK